MSGQAAIPAATRQNTEKTFQFLLSAKGGNLVQIREAKKTDSEAINILSLDFGYDVVSQEVADNRIGEILETEIDNLWVLSVTLPI